MALLIMNMRGNSLTNDEYERKWFKPMMSMRGNGLTNDEYERKLFDQ